MTKKSNVIDLAEAISVVQKRARINSVNIMDAVFMQNGKKIKVSKMVREHWKFTGLDTIDFIMDRLYSRQGKFYMDKTIYKGE